MHLAAFVKVEESVKNPKKYLENNFENSKILFETCIENKLYNKSYVLVNIQENIDVGEAKNPPTEAKLSQPKKTTKKNKISKDNKDKKIKNSNKSNV